MFVPIRPDTTSYAVWPGLFGIKADCCGEIDDRLAVLALQIQDVAAGRIGVGIIFCVFQRFVHIRERFLEAAFIGQDSSAAI